MASKAHALWLAAIAFALTFTPAALADDTNRSAIRGPDGIVGEWWTHERDGRIRFYRYRDGTYRGVVAWSKHPKLDTENDDPKLRTRPIVGIVMMWKLRYEDGEYEDGYVYNPEDGNVYRFDAKVLSRDKLEIHGYLGIALLGESHVWTRYR